MQIIFLPQYLTILLCFFVWPLIQICVAVIVRAMPDSCFSYNLLWFRTYNFEKNGKTYERIFKIKRWKHLLPDGSAITGVGMRKKNLNDMSSDNLTLYLSESCRAELIHVLAIPPFILFGLFCPFYVVPIMLVYAIAANTPCILAQRYNRPRVLKLLRKQTAKNNR